MFKGSFLQNISNTCYFAENKNKNPSNPYHVATEIAHLDVRCLSKRQKLQIEETVSVEICKNVFCCKKKKNQLKFKMN